MRETHCVWDAGGCSCSSDELKGMREKKDAQNSDKTSGSVDIWVLSFLPTLLRGS